MQNSIYKTIDILIFWTSYGHYASTINENDIVHSQNILFSFLYLGILSSLS